MPKRNESRHSSGRVQGPSSGWEPSKRLEYHITEMALHLHMVETILKTEPEGSVMRVASQKAVIGLRLQMGTRVRRMYKILELNCPNVLKQSHTWVD